MISRRNSPLVELTSLAAERVGSTQISPVWTQQSRPLGFAQYISDSTIPNQKPVRASNPQAGEVTPDFDHIGVCYYVWSMPLPIRLVVGHQILDLGARVRILHRQPESMRERGQISPAPARHRWPVRLVAQDTALSRLKQGFDSPTGYQLLWCALFDRHRPSSMRDNRA